MVISACIAAASLPPQEPGLRFAVVAAVVFAVSALIRDWGVGALVAAVAFAVYNGVLVEPPTGDVDVATKLWPLAVLGGVVAIGQILRRWRRHRLPESTDPGM